MTPRCVESARRSQDPASHRAQTGQSSQEMLTSLAHKAASCLHQRLPPSAMLPVALVTVSHRQLFTGSHITSHPHLPPTPPPPNLPQYPRLIKVPTIPPSPDLISAYRPLLCARRRQPRCLSRQPAHGALPAQRGPEDAATDPHAVRPSYERLLTAGVHGPRVARAAARAAGVHSLINECSK